ncbi:hypothetical protein BASA61_003468 [Batrachochytrium salamandrivorans]|nr:hypothetical protein BASA60_004412 [Batrachochytrium salamandrivorans]KAH6596540.1 hypothetical protein BASA61_003468 [Batrachochytrium salamandrivorans]
MKVNVLVAAAMVITSVNASGRGRPRGLLKQGDGSGLESEAPFGLKVYPLFLQKRPAHDSDTPQVPEPIEKDLICNPLLLELAVAWTDIDVFNYKFETQDERFCKLIMGQNTGEISDGLDVTDDEEGKEVALRAVAIQKYIKENPGDIPRLQEIQAEYISLEKVYREIWAKLKKSKCVTEGLKRTSSPKNMIKGGRFPKWKDVKGKDILRKQ